MSERARALTPGEIEAYRRDGVVCLRGVLNDDWVAVVRDAVDDAERRHGAPAPARSPIEDLDASQEHSRLHALGPLGDTLEELGAEVLRESKSSDADGELAAQLFGAHNPVVWPRP